MSRTDMNSLRTGARPRADTEVVTASTGSLKEFLTFFERDTIGIVRLRRDATILQATQRGHTRIHRSSRCG